MYLDIQYIRTSVCFIVRCKEYASITRFWSLWEDYRV